MSISWEEYSNIEILADGKNADSAFSVLVSSVMKITFNHLPHNYFFRKIFFKNKYYYSHAPLNDVLVNNGPHIQRWSHKIIIL